MGRPDSSITYLRTFGYSVFRTPRPDALPLEVFERNGRDLTRLGNISQLIIGDGAPLPLVKSGSTPGIDIEGKETSSMNVNIGLSLLGAFIGAIGGQNAGLQLGFTNAKTVTFSFKGVVEDSIDVLRLEEYVVAGRVNPGLPPGTALKLIEDELYVVSSVLKSAELLVKATASKGATAKLDVPVIKSAVGGNVAVEQAGGLESTVSFKGPVPIGFGFQAVRLMFDDSGEFMTTSPLKAGDAAARGLQAAPARADGRVFLDLGGQLGRFE